jgi:myo-inositol 2-dehydrogenase/D-chiro-inositol 1-dehydrogenase
MELIRHHGVAIVGCGWAGVRHAKAFVAEGAQLRWAVDNDPARAAMIAGLQSGVRAVTRLEQALSDSAVTVVDVCTPHNLHTEICMKALEAGKDVLCEKPLAPALSDADKMVTAAETAGMLLMVAENECFDPRYERIRDLIAAGTIGEPALAQATRECFLRESFLRDRPWYLSPDQSGGGILLSGGIHDFAKLRMVVGEITLVHSLRARQRFKELGTEDTVVLALGFQNGAVGTLVESFFMLDPTTAAGQEVHRLRIDGDEGSIEVTGPDRVRISTLQGPTRELKVPAEDTFRAEVRELLDCVQTRREPRTSARSQRRNLELVEAAYASIAVGHPVQL